MSGPAITTAETATVRPAAATASGPDRERHLTASRPRPRRDSAAGARRAARAADLRRSARRVPRRGGRHLRRRRAPRPLRGHQARRDPPHRAAEDDDAPAHPHGEDRGHRRVHGAEEAGPDLQDPQGAGQAERPDVRRGDARGPARRLRLPPEPRLQLPPLPRRHLRLAQPDPPVRPQDRRDRLGPDPAAQGERALLRPAAGRGDQLRGPRQAQREGRLRRPDAAASPGPDPARDHQRRDQHAGRRPGHADRLRPARPDRRAAADRQDDPAPEDRQQHPDQPPRRLRHGPADRRAARGSHRHGALGQGADGRGDQLDLRRARLAAHPGGRDGHREGQADGRVRQGRRDPARLDHPAGPGLQHRGAALGQDPHRRHRRLGPAEAQAVLRRRPQDRGGRQPDDPGHRPGRHRQPHGRRDLRGVQGHRQHGAAPRPPAGRQADLAGHRRQPLGHPPRRAAHGPRGAAPRLDPPPRPERHEPRRGHGAARPAGCGRPRLNAEFLMSMNLS